MMYDELVKRLKSQCYDCKLWDGEKCCLKGDCSAHTRLEAADAIEELLKAAKAMHTWIFLHTGDEQAAYDECGLSDEMNAALGYGGQFVAEPPKEE